MEIRVVAVGYTGLRDLSDKELELLPGEERQREFGVDSRRRQFQCARALLRLMLEESTGKPAAQHRFELEQGGKPLNPGGPAISIAHTNDMVVCGIVERGLIGIDIERIEAERDTAQIVNRFFSGSEIEWVNAGTKERFFMLWVLKEAFVKAHGQSIFGGLEKLRCTVEPPKILASVTERGFRDLRLYQADGTFLGLATTDVAIDDLQIRHWEPHSRTTQPGNDFDLIAGTTL